MARLRVCHILDSVFGCGRSNRHSKRASQSDHSTDALPHCEHEREPAGSARPQADAQNAPETLSFHQHAQNIAKIPVNGMRRADNMSFIGSYDTTQRPSPSYPAVQVAHPRKAAQDTATSSQTDSTGDTLVGYAADLETKDKMQQGPDVTKSTWQGKPNGTAYDSRQELTEDDEDMWARLAM